MEQFGTEWNQYIIMLGVLLSPAATFFAVEWRARAKHKWALENLEAERAHERKERDAQRESDRLEREQVAEVIKAQLEADNRQFRHSVKNDLAPIKLQTSVIEKKLEENTAVTRRAATEAGRAYTEANNFNEKLAEQREMSKRAAQQLAEVERRFSELLQGQRIDRIDQDDRITAIRDTTETIEEVSIDTNERVKKIEGQNVEPAD